MSQEPDHLLELCRAARRHEEPDAAARRALAARLAARGLLPLGGAASVLLAPSAASASTSSALAGGAGAGAGLVTAATGSGAVAVGAKASLAVAALYVASGMGGGLLLATGGARLLRPAPPARSTTSQASAPAPAAPRTITPALAPATAPTPAPVASAEPGSPAPKLVATQPATEPRRAPRPTSTLGDETRGLMQAQRALRDGDAAGALRLLDAQGRLHGSGGLSAERQAARIFALCAARRLAEARAERARFLAAHGDSPLAARVRDSCAEQEL